MKIQGFHKTGLAMAAALAVACAPSLHAQDTTIATPAPMTPSVPTAATTQPLSSAASQVLQLSQAKISDSTIITYVQTSGTMYGLNASQIVYLKQQGVSETVINAMLTQRTAMATTPQPAASAPTPSTTVPYDQTATVAQPSAPVPASSSVYVVPDTQTYYYNNWASPYYSYPYYYPYYGYYGSPVVFSFGFHGGYGGGWHGGGGFHTGGGGFHGGGGGGWHH